jgi:hypothetical protein
LASGTNQPAASLKDSGATGDGRKDGDFIVDGKLMIRSGRAAINHHAAGSQYSGELGTKSPREVLAQAPDRAGVDFDRGGTGDLAKSGKQADRGHGVS